MSLSAIVTLVGQILSFFLNWKADGRKAKKLWLKKIMDQFSKPSDSEIMHDQVTESFARLRKLREELLARDKKEAENDK